MFNRMSNFELLTNSHDFLENGLIRKNLSEAILKTKNIQFFAYAIFKKLSTR